ncbi:hypothetical protein [Neorhizobium galegae]|uniref:hypothetical protein n=1 Tax=Neorhizobium galegae TaxID=399 RepID=UPI0020C76A6C|nr:hypothetical protein [Neorhizobium galegae]
MASRTASPADFSGPPISIQTTVIGSLEPEHGETLMLQLRVSPALLRKRTGEPSGLSSGHPAKRSATFVPFSVSASSKSAQASAFANMTKPAAFTMSAASGQDSNNSIISAPSIASSSTAYSTGTISDERLAGRMK